MHPLLTKFSSDAVKVIAHLRGEFAKLQTGRASAALIDHVNIEAYGQLQPLRNVASIGIVDARTITVQPWDQGVLGNIEKALQKANLGCNPVNEGRQLRLALPSMTEERRRDLTKVVHALAEESRIGLRRQRGDVHTAIKNDEGIPEDEERRLLDALQKEVDKLNGEIETLSKHKEEELLKI